MFVSGAGSLNAAWSSAAKAWCCDACTACGASPAIGWIRIASGLAMKTPLRKRVEADAVTRSLPVPSDGLEEAVRPAEPEIAQQLEGMRAVDFVVLDRRVVQQHHLAVLADVLTNLRAGEHREVVLLYHTPVEHDEVDGTHAFELLRDLGFGRAYRLL